MYQTPREEYEAKTSAPKVTDIQLFIVRILLHN